MAGEFDKIKVGINPLRIMRASNQSFLDSLTYMLEHNEVNNLSTIGDLVLLLRTRIDNLDSEIRKPS